MATDIRNLLPSSFNDKLLYEEIGTAAAFKMGGGGVQGTAPAAASLLPELRADMDWITLINERITRPFTVRDVALCARLNQLGCLPMTSGVSATDMYQGYPTRVVHKWKDLFLENNVPRKEISVHVADGDSVHSMHEANDGCGNVCREVDANVYCTAVYRAHQLIKLCETMIALWRDSEGKSTLKQRVCRRCQTTEAELKEQGLGKLKQCQRCTNFNFSFCFE